MYEDPMKVFLATAPIIQRPEPVPVPEGEKRKKKKHAIAIRLKLLNSFVDSGMRPHSSDSAVWLFLWRHAKANGICVRGGISDIAKHANLGTATVERSLKRLANDGYIKQIAKGFAGGSASSYQIFVPSPGEEE